MTYALTGIRVTLVALGLIIVYVHCLSSNHIMIDGDQIAVEGMGVLDLTLRDDRAEMIIAVQRFCDAMNSSSNEQEFPESLSRFGSCCVLSSCCRNKSRLPTLNEQGIPAICGGESCDNVRIPDRTGLRTNKRPGQSYLAVSKCDQNYFGDAKQKCSNPNPALLEDLSLVHSPGRSVTYLNRHCARCNHVAADTITPWTAQLECDRFPSLAELFRNSSEPWHERLGRHGCQIRWIPVRNATMCDLQAGIKLCVSSVTHGNALVHMSKVCQQTQKSYYYIEEVVEKVFCENCASLPIVINDDLCDRMRTDRYVATINWNISALFYSLLGSDEFAGISGFGDKLHTGSDIFTQTGKNLQITTEIPERESNLSNHVLEAGGAGQLSTVAWDKTDKSNPKFQNKRIPASSKQNSDQQCPQGLQFNANVGKCLNISCSPSQLYFPNRVHKCLDLVTSFKGICIGYIVHVRFPYVTGESDLVMWRDRALNEATVLLGPIGLGYGYNFYETASLVSDRGNMATLRVRVIVDLLAEARNIRTLYNALVKAAENSIGKEIEVTLKHDGLAFESLHADTIDFVYFAKNQLKRCLIVQGWLPWLKYSFANW